jgi:hypothetical protein
MEIAQHKSSNFPMLKEVIMEEERLPGPDMSMEWEYPEDILMAYKTAEILLFVGWHLSLW